MVMACGVGEFQYGVAHVMTHAFFKACLFLGAGSVIHALHHEQNIYKMGGLLKKMPITGTTFIIATLAIIGFPGFSGFFSKDAILSAAWGGTYGHPILWAVGAITAGLTAFYMLRLTWLVFFGQCRNEHPSHIHETNLVITFPLMILAILSIIGGSIAVPEILTGKQDFITHFLEPVLKQAHFTMDAFKPKTHAPELALMGASTLIVLCSAIFAIFVYREGPEGGKKFANTFGGLYRLILDKWRVDEMYDIILVQPIAKLGRLFFSFVHNGIIENFVNGVPDTLYTGTSVASDAQTGMVRNYLKLFFIGLILFGLIFFY
jgi:NADH-quinone oxidoreductase subunit L